MFLSRTTLMLILAVGGLSSAGCDSDPLPSPDDERQGDKDPIVPEHPEDCEDPGDPGDPHSCDESVEVCLAELEEVCQSDPHPEACEDKINECTALEELCDDADEPMPPPGDDDGGDGDGCAPPPPPPLPTCEQKQQGCFEHADELCAQFPDVCDSFVEECEDLEENCEETTPECREMIIECFENACSAPIIECVEEASAGGCRF